MAIQFGTLADWVGAIATFGAVCVALYTSLNEVKARRKQDESSQAVKISAWPVAGPLGLASVVISNSSYEPIYDVTLSYGIAYGAGVSYLKGNDELVFIKTVPPGIYKSKEPRNHGGAMHTQLGVAVSFRDARGQYWLRDAKGKIYKLTTSNYRVLEVQEPISDWASITSYKVS